MAEPIDTSKLGPISTLVRRENERTALATLCSFLVHLRDDKGDNAMWGSRRVSEAVEALSVMTGIPVATIESVAYAGRRK
jgi:hypothetical protein